MIISDGTTSLTFSYAENNTPDSEIEDVIKYTVDGSIKQQVSGERFKQKEMVAVTGAELRTLLDLLKNGAQYYYYTPTSTPPEYSSAVFPKKVKVTYKGKKTRAFNGEIIYYIDLEILGVDLE